MNPYKQYIDEHYDEFGLHPSKQWWVKYVYHFSNIDNIVNILEQGYLYSRNECIRRGLMQNENASKEIINQTEGNVRDCVRLYFRPKTPTQFYNEGFSTSEERKKYESAHVPVPVFLAFRSYEILNLEDCYFSDGSLATHDFHLYKGFERYKTLDFKSIYHDESLNNENKGYILQKRQSEIAIQNRLSLDFLDLIWCRSNAEYVTLINLLHDRGISEKYRNKISVKQASNLFFMHHTYIDIVNMDMDSIAIYLKNVSNDGNIEMKVILKMGLIEYPKQVTLKAGEHYIYDMKKFRSNIERYGGYKVEIYFCDKTVDAQNNVLVYYGNWTIAFDLPY